MTTIGTALGISGLVMALALSAGAAGAAETVIEGVFAQPGVAGKVGGEMKVRETGPLSLELEIVFTDAATGEQVQSFDEDLTQELHILAIDSTLTTLVHEHVKEADADGTFRAPVTFPEPGLYHIYADAHPTGLGQQVVRFDVAVPAGAEAGAPRLAADADVSVAFDGPYRVEVDTSAMEALAESPVTVAITRDGAPATDLSPYLGVAAHAVFIRMEDLAYVHVHPTTEGGGDGHPHADATGHSHGATPAPAAGLHEHHAAPAADETAVAPAITLHVTAPGPGPYALFLQFMGDGEVRTTSFALEVPATTHHHH